MNAQSHPRTELVAGPTPLYSLSGLSADLGIRLSIKRDDVAGAPFAGNKSRQLEFHLGAAVAAGADAILISGAVQSNFVRAAAAAANSFRLKTVVQLEDRVPDMDEDYRTSGNVLLLRVLGADIIRFPAGEDERGADDSLRLAAGRLTEQGHRPYVIPLAPDNPPVGALGYVRASEELLDQAGDFDFVIAPSGSGMTHAGLLAGLHQAGSSARVVGSCVRRSAELQSQRMRTVMRGLAGLIGEHARPSTSSILLWDGALKPGYGRFGQTTVEAMKMMARREGIVLDPVYSAKAFAAIPALVQSGQIPAGSRVLFVHTGGLAALFGYKAEIERLF